MNSPKRRLRRDERGASLILVVGFIVFAGTLMSSIVAYAGSGLSDRVVLDNARNREYDADSAIQQAIVQARQTGGPIASWAAGSTSLTTYLASAQCAPSGTGIQTAAPFHLNQPRGIYVQCAPAPTLSPAGQYQYDVMFTACTASSCAANSVVIRAQVNFTLTGGSVSSTYVQSWSVNG